MNNQNQQETTNLVNKEFLSSNHINCDKVNADIKWDNTFRNKLKNEIGYYTDAVEDVTTAQKNIFSGPTLAPEKDVHNIKHEGLSKLYNEWMFLYSDNKPQLVHNWADDMAAIYKELDFSQSSHITLLSECKKEFAIYDQKRKDQLNAENNLKKGFCGITRLTDHHEIEQNKTECSKHFEFAKKKYDEVERKLQIELTSYENWRQNTLLKCITNLLFNNIQLHGKVCENLTSITPHLIESEQKIQYQNVIPNRFLRVKK